MEFKEKEICDHCPSEEKVDVVELAGVKLCRICLRCALSIFNVQGEKK